MAQDNDVVSHWSQSAPYWEKHREIIRTMFAPITEALVADANIIRGHNVLDVGTGPGEPALRVAEFVGQKGKVCGIDPAPEMIAAARRAADRGGFENLHFEVASADRLSFAADTFDAVVSRFAVMFFRSPFEGIQEILRVLKPDGRLAFAVWHFAERNPFHYLLWRVVDRYVEATPTPPDSPDAFRFASPGKLLTILGQAGSAATSERLLQFTIQAPLSVEDFWDLRSEMSDKLRSKLTTLSADQVAEVKSQVVAALRPYSSREGVSLPAEVLIVSGGKP